MKPTITAHCMVKNEDQFVAFAIRSVIEHVDTVLVFDTGSTDSTVDIVEQLAAEFPEKIVFEQKGPCDKRRHTELRNEMVDRTTTEWWMILDGDEVWTDRGMQEATSIMSSESSVACIIAPFYLCVGDIYHASWRGKHMVRGKRAHAMPRFYRNTKGIHWSGEYERDQILDEAGIEIHQKKEVVFLKNRYWHCTHLLRSTASDAVYSSGGERGKKQIPTYLCIGKRIRVSVPSVFLQSSASSVRRQHFLDAARHLFIHIWGRGASFFQKKNN